MSSPKHIYIAAGISVLVLALAIIGGAYIHAMVSAGKQEQLRADVQQQIAGLRDDLKSQLATVKQDAKVTEPRQIVQKLPQYIPLPSPIYLQPPQSATSPLPDAPGAIVRAGGVSGSLIVPPESVADFWKHETECKADSLKLAECQKELPLITKRAESAEKVMKGGSFMSRVKAKAKYLVIGAVAGAVAATAARR